MYVCVCVCVYTSPRSAGRKYKHMAVSISQLPSNIKTNVCCTAWLNKQ